MEYNTSLPKMIIPEYGRNIQKMIDFAITVADKEERNKVARAIIDVMGQLNPHLRDVTDFKHKLWDHLFIISEFKLDVDSPYPRPTPETFQTKPELLKYPSNDIRYKHYGKTVERIIEKAKEYPEGDERNALVEQIANLMKRSYLNWNRDSVNDEVILKQLGELSKGQLKLADNSSLRSTQAFVPRNTNQQQRAGGDKKRVHNNNGGKQNNNNNPHRHKNNNNQNFKRKPF
ncbi:MAG: DUF4290 domain-containing protein [Bacteroidetes bacterium]|nr:DUF4290 domain-containing protein [Bacteroidota bacterium]